ncbi:Gfo/Idh/MocA family oxidoreductase [Leptobacterium flavescens]|uniref:Gfo/Idh/MocA family oxidoreductase n=1 Tax=Leptobacterium flavescens TaxID=472055 RepID=A0A6P0UPY2_9FLAO|nr:Gfo/Idh/MocA family oxidoreductase [Leptobacterium flavescens]NER14038.1 Gfo/Idh/MocA family oxidoreductase [Leptobacterium flavescens]
MALPEKVVRWGIIGPGRIAHKFAQDLQQVAQAELYAVASRDLKKAEEFASEYNAPRSYGTYNELVEDPEVDIVYIATPHVFHYENSLLCLRNRKAVLCEKPLAMNTEQVSGMIKAAKENDTLFMEAMWTCFLPHFRFALDFIREEKLGKVKKLEADFGFYAAFDPNSRLFNKELGGGTLLDIGIYPVFAALSSLGYPDEIEADANLCQTGVDDECLIRFKYKNGAVARLKSTVREDTPTKAVFYCEQGELHLNTRFHEATDITIKPDNGKEETLDFGYTSRGYSYEAAHMTELFLQGKKESPLMSFEMSLQLIQLLDKIRNLIGLKY